MSDSSLQKAQEIHSKLRDELLSKSRLIGTLESRLKEKDSELLELQKKCEVEKKRGQQEAAEKEATIEARQAELAAREAEITAAEAALQSAQTKVEQEKTEARQEVEKMEALVRDIEASNLALTRERDAALSATAVATEHFHNQLISLSRNHLDQTNDDIQRLSTLKSENDRLRIDISVRFPDALTAAARTEADLRSELTSVRSRAIEDETRWKQQKDEWQTLLADNRAEMEQTSRRVKEETAKELARLQDKIASDSTLSAALQQWEARRAESDKKFLARGEELKLLRVELNNSILRYESLDHASSQRDVDAQRRYTELESKYNECSLQLQKKSAALQVYHRTIKANQLELEKITKLQAQQQKLHSEQQLQAQQQIAALSGDARRGSSTKTNGAAAASSGGSISDVFSSLFKSTADREREESVRRASADRAVLEQARSIARKISNAADEAAAASAAAAATATATDADGSSLSVPVGPKRSLSGDDDMTCTLNEEMAVALSKRVEALEDERLTLTQQTQELTKKLKNAEILIALHSEQQKKDAAATSGKGEDKKSKKEDDGASSASGADSAPKKKSILGSLLGSSKSSSSSSSKDPLSDPSHVKALLESSLSENGALAAEKEKQSKEIARLKTLLDAAKGELAEAKTKATATAAVAAATAGKKGKNQQQQQQQQQNNEQKKQEESAAASSATKE